ncbi:uncharacterized protein LACBIDRAFT_330410 [Laccaria bicolor S238N-H82]|uniref:Predicted protein n=1 Tax=Laccaria bicolor (strain S238N-H82 / ATCC MYA-4686) TaxID=486041 RepID=B0DL79_LACBS|nr:uncharacterized protein LACBIDRAFT_330410 [Laccaria bicolor S238N-H82]EDR04515.1 predicted protein [Laccaria bicolor S238N-H82]|eukprot:XP_001884687.1 predicted protein [Laccaria bicolor S238N-H82]
MDRKRPVLGGSVRFPQYLALNGALKGNTRYRFAFTEGGYRSYHGRRPKRGGRSAADDRTTMLDKETGFWVPIPANYTAPHTPEDLIEAENDIRIQDRRCIAYVHPETRKAFKELNASREPGDPEIHPLHVYDISEGEEAALVAGLKGEEAAYKFRKPWEEGHSRYQGSLPQEGAQNAADRRTEMWDNETQMYCMLPAGYMAPHDPQDYVDAVNHELARAEQHRRSAIILARRQLRPRKEEGKKEKVTALEDWEAPDPMIESDVTGSDYEEGRLVKAWTMTTGPGIGRHDKLLW